VLYLKRAALLKSILVSLKEGIFKLKRSDVLINELLHRPFCEEISTDLQVIIIENLFDPKIIQIDTFLRTLSQNLAILSKNFESLSVRLPLSDSQLKHVVHLFVD
jgi:hypothetical protein